MHMFRTSMSVTVILMSMAVLVGMVAAMPPAQGGFGVPTATFFPTDPEPRYELSTVTGEYRSYSWGYLAESDVEMFGGTLETNYPNGFIAEVTVFSDDPIDTVSLIFVNETENEFEAQLFAESGSSTYFWPDLYNLNSTFIVWAPVDAFFRVTTITGTVVESESVEILYDDPTREWNVATRDDVSVYWYGQDIEPDVFAALVFESFDATVPRLEQSFGMSLNPAEQTLVFYPDRAGAHEISQEENPYNQVQGFNVWQNGMSVMIVDSSIDINIDCPLVVPADNRDALYDAQRAARLTMPAVLFNSFLFQSNFVFNNVTSWWFQGMLSWHTMQPDIIAEDRLRSLALNGYPMPRLNEQTGLPSATNAPDGCAALDQSVGYSFINWLDANYGIEAIAAIQDGITVTTFVIDAIEEVTGEDFLTLENRWRALMGFAQALPPVDPLDVIADAPNSPYQAGDVFTIPTTARVFIHAQPGDLFAVGGCPPQLSATVLRAGELDSAIWLEIDCNGLVGWARLSDIQAEQ